MEEGPAPSLMLGFSVARAAVVEPGGGIVGIMNDVFGRLGVGSTNAVVVDWTKLAKGEVGLKPLE